MPCLEAAVTARSSQSRSYWPSLGSIRLQANSPMRTIWIPACSIRVRSASQRDSGHCSGYHAVPSMIGGGGGVCGHRGADRRITVKIERSKDFILCDDQTVRIDEPSCVRDEKPKTLAVRRGSFAAL